MQLQFTDEQFKELVFLAMIGEYVRGGVMDLRGEYDPNIHSILLEYLFKEAYKAGRTDIAEKFEDSFVPTDAFSAAEDELMEEYNDDEFWSQLSNRLGRRDFERDMTDEERREIKESGWLPERAHEFYKKYEDEFENYGVERLEIKKE